MTIHNRKICANCKKRDKNGLCYIKAATMPPNAPMCEYGLKIEEESKYKNNKETK